MDTLYIVTSVSAAMFATVLFAKASRGEARWFWGASALWVASAALSVVRAVTAEPFVLAGLSFLFVAGMQLLVSVLFNPPLFDRLYLATRRNDPFAKDELPATSRLDETRE